MWTIQELADFLKIDYTNLYKRVKSGQVKAIKFGTQWRITEEEVERVKKEGF